MSAENPDFDQFEENGKIWVPKTPSQEDLTVPEKSEHIPSEREVHAVFQELIKQPYTESRKREDEKGLYLLDVTIPGKKDGEVIEYSYMRAGRYKEGQASNTRIDKAIYQDGIPEGGDGVTELVDGKWKIFAS